MITLNCDSDYDSLSLLGFSHEHSSTNRKANCVLLLRYKDRRRQESLSLACRILENGGEREEEQRTTEADAHHPHRHVLYCYLICQHVLETRDDIYATNPECLRNPFLASSQQ